MERHNHRERQFSIYDQQRRDAFQYYYFSPQDLPGGYLVAQQVQAQSYLNNGFVYPEGFVRLPAGQIVLAPDVADPSDIRSKAGEYTECILGIEKGTHDLDPLTGSMVTWRKRYAPLDALPTYDFCKDHLRPGWEDYLRNVEADPSRTLVEPEGLGKTINTGRGVVTEFMRNEIQRAYGRGEIWFMGLVESTVFASFVHNWGPLAVRQIGDAKSFDHPHVNPNVRLVPSIMNIDTFFLDYYDHLQTRLLSGELTDRELEQFIYMAEGMSDQALGQKVAKLRNDARIVLRESGQ